ncbi:AraC family transcriptional regulator [Acinetobacter calcoaceticus]|uniref:AraC family transcriptional regulator n=1 Tax=Acinetobacter calcoaceticus TaxID=471 RepID=UPI0002EAB4D8|nr:AraC family transcriptional regulator ligand-binding domain-containing protein [Acinetobacter calcoaceticus]
MNNCLTQTNLMKIRANSLKGYISAMRELMIDPYLLLDQYKLTIDLLENDEILISQQTVIQLLEDSASLTNCPDLGLRISTHQDISILGILSIMLQNASSMRKAIDYAAHFLYLYGQGFSLSYNGQSPLIHNAFEVVFEASYNGPPPRQSMDLCIGTIHQHAKCLFGKDYGLKAVSFPYDKSASLSMYQKVFNVPIYFNQERASLHISKDFLLLEPNGSNPLLRQIVEDYILRNFSMRNDSFSDRVKKTLRLNLGTSQTSKINISNLLAIHPRTLQRRLKDENTTFEEIKDNLRKDLAIYYITQTTIPFYQLTSLLGFPEQSALSRAIKRWYNLTPTELRVMRFIKS